MEKKIIVITAGDPSSIAPYISLQALLQVEEPYNFCLVANYNFMQRVAKYYQLEVTFIKIKALSDLHVYQTQKIKAIYILDIEFSNFNDNINLEDFLGVRDFKNSQYVLKSLDQSIDMALNKEAVAIVTNPIDKDLVNQYINSNINHNTFQNIKENNFYGHTGYLAQKSGINTVVMMMATPFNKLKVIPFTTHMALNKVAEEITANKLLEVINITLEFFKHKFKISQPSIGVCGLNPHSGENGLMGREEIEVINPLIKKLQQQGLNIQGAIPADTIFVPHISEQFDVIIGMYHDQVLAPFKAFYFDEGVNTTLGLPFIRTSPDHGCAFVKAKGKEASCKSLVAAMLMAQKLS